MGLNLYQRAMYSKQGPTSENELMHHGVQGMHWGIRRYQPYGEGGYNPKHLKRPGKFMNALGKVNDVAADHYEKKETQYAKAAGKLDKSKFPNGITKQVLLDNFEQKRRESAMYARMNRELADERTGRNYDAAKKRAKLKEFALKEAKNYERYKDYYDTRSKIEREMEHIADGSGNSDDPRFLELAKELKVLNKNHDKQVEKDNKDLTYNLFGGDKTFKDPKTKTAKSQQQALKNYKQNKQNSFEKLFKAFPNLDKYLEETNQWGAIDEHSIDDIIKYYNNWNKRS